MDGEQEINDLELEGKILDKFFKFNKDERRKKN